MKKSKVLGALQRSSIPRAWRIRRDETDLRGSSTRARVSKPNLDAAGAAAAAAATAATTAAKVKQQRQADKPIQQKQLNSSIDR